MNAALPLPNRFLGYKFDSNPVPGDVSVSALTTITVVSVTPSTATATTSLTPLQSQVLDSLLQGQNVFLTGGAGVGKSHVLKSIIDIMRSRGSKIIVTASTGVAATLLGGATLHSQIGLGLAQEPLNVLLNKARRSVKLRERWRLVDLLIIDECSMLHPDFFDLCDQVLRVLRECDNPFGGVQLLLSGDFFQLPPVLPSGRDPALATFIFQTTAWRTANLTIVNLVDIFRQAGELAGILSRVRRAEHTLDDIIVLAGRVGAILNSPLGVEPTRMYSHKICVDSINSQKLEELTADAHVFTARIFTEVDKTPKNRTSSNQPQHLTLAQKEAMLADARVQILKNVPVPLDQSLKMGAQVMLVVNLDQESGLVNGSRGVITGFRMPPVGSTHGESRVLMPVVQFMGKELLLNVYIWKHEIYGAGVVSYMQVPLRLAWAVTIHKAQGLSLDFVDMKLDRSVFEYGQSYVGLSRVRTLAGLRLTGFDPSAIRAHPLVKQFYAELDLA